MDNIKKKALITDLIEGVTKILREQKYSDNTLGAYSATWNKYLAYSPTEYYDPSIADDFLEDFYFTTLSSSKQHLDSTMRHARRHIYVLDEYFRTGNISRRVARYANPVDKTRYEYFFEPYLAYSRKKLFSELLSPELGLTGHNSCTREKIQANEKTGDSRCGLRSRRTRL